VLQVYQPSMAADVVNATELQGLSINMNHYSQTADFAVALTVSTS
jgi:hypothetical protein